MALDDCRWRQDLHSAAIGVAVAAGLEFLTHAPRSRGRVLVSLGLAGGLAVVYARFVPRLGWGVRSGAGFARLPPIAGIEAKVGDGSPSGLAVWGALTGGLVRMLASD